MTLHSTTPPRHARVFDILHQSDLAVDVTKYVKQFQSAPSQPEQIEAFQHLALTSFERSVQLGPEAGRDDKLL